MDSNTQFRNVFVSIAALVGAAGCAGQRTVDLDAAAATPLVPDERSQDVADVAAVVEACNRALEGQLAELQTKVTERSLALTLGDVRFDTGQASPKPGAGSTMDRLAQFLRDHPGRHVLIEGHTDARGSDDSNRVLSKRRADSVRDALVGLGIEAQRIRSVGLGEVYPVADNDTAVGMQQNRRTELVISDETGALWGETQHTAATTTDWRN